MAKALLIAVSVGFGGYGDFLFALKLAQQLKKHYLEAGEEPPPVYIVTQPAGQKQIRALKGDTEFGVTALSPAELREKIEAHEIEVGHLFEGPVFQMNLIEQIDAALSTTPTPIPLTMIPEYGYSSELCRTAIASYEAYRQSQFSHVKHANTIYSGFNERANEHGIFLTDTLVAPPSSDVLVSKLDEKIRGPLIGTGDLARYREHTELSMQYSHDKFTTNPTPAVQFLNIHRELAKSQDKNQDVIMVGNGLHFKYEALESIKEKLITDGFQRISFYNTNTKEESFLYDSGHPGKAYRAIYADGMSHESMIACSALSSSLTGATGDQSLGEALSGNKIVVYECIAHKRDLIENYDDEIIKASENNSQIVEILRLLRTAKTDAEYDRLGTLLRDPAIQTHFAELNKFVMRKYDLATKIVHDGLGWNPNQVANLLQQGKQQEALELAQKGTVNIFVKVAGKSLFEYARENDPDGIFVQFFKIPEQATLQCFDARDKTAAFHSLREVGVNFLTAVVEGKPALAKAIEAKQYDFASKIIEGATTDADRRLLCEILQSQSPNGESYLSQLRREYPGSEHPTTEQALYLSTLERLEQYHPKPATRRAQMHHSFQALVDTFRDTSVAYDEKALIGLLLLNARNIESEYTFLSPRKGHLLGSRLYTACADALMDLGVDLKNISPAQQAEYFQALESVINKKPDFLANEYVLESLREQAGITFPSIVQPLVSTRDAKAILTGKKSIADDPSVLRTETGFYKLFPEKIGEGGWGSVYAAHHFSLNNGEVQVSKPLAIKHTHKAALLDKEYRLFQQSYPDKYFERFDVGGNKYLAMPLFSGVPLDTFLISQDISPGERRLMAMDLLAGLHHIHEHGVIHNDIKPKNILFDPVTKKIHILDFGCAEETGAQMKYENLMTAKYAIEYMPPEYLAGTRSTQENDIYSMTLSLAEILGVNKREVVQARMEQALSSIENEPFKRNLREAFAARGSLDEALFSLATNRSVQAFVQNYVSGQYDFAPYSSQLGENGIALLNAMQAKNPEERPSVGVCLEQLRIIGVDVNPTDVFKTNLRDMRSQDKPSPDEEKSEGIGFID